MSIEEQCAAMFAADPYAQSVVAAIAREPVAQVTVRALANGVASMYEQGASHAEVTAILDRMVGGDFRKYLVEIHDEHGPCRWMLAPSKVSIVVYAAPERV